MSPNKINETFASLQSPNYRLWFFGQMFSLVGTWMQSTAQGYLVFDLTHSAAYLGYVSIANGLPTILFTLFGGVIADRIPRRRLLVITQSSMLVLAGILAGLTFTNVVKPWHIILLAFLLGISNAFDTPARQSFVSEMVERKNMTNAIALNSTMFNIGTVVGPAFAGLVYAWLGPSWCFTINAISFIAVIAALLMMKLANVIPPPPSNHSALKEMWEGITFSAKDPVIRDLLINLGLVGTFAFSLLNLMPAWAVDVLKGNVETNSWLLSARGVGSLIGALMIAYIGSGGVRGKVWFLGYLLTPVFFYIFAFIQWVPASLFMLVLIGWAVMAMINTSNALIQSHVPDALRGRVMGVYSLVFLGGTPIGAFFAGELADRIGTPNTVILFTTVVMISALYTFFRRPQLRKLN